MNWHQHPELRDRLAAEYALGTLKGGARRRFEAVMRAHPDVARAAARWDERLQPLTNPLPPLPASDALWARIAERSFGGAGSADPVKPAGAGAVPKAGARAGARASAGVSAQVSAWWQRWLAPIPAAALSLGLVLGLALPLVAQLGGGQAQDTQLPESYVGVLATAEGKPGLIVSSLRRGHTVDLKLLQRQPLPDGQVFVLWTLDAQGAAQAVGALPPFGSNFVSLALPGPAEDLFARAVELAVSIEPAGRLPAQPSAAFVYRGLCGKLWPVSPAPASAASSGR